MKFSRNSINGVRTEIEIHDDCALDEVLEEFQNFLRACGYMIEYNKVITIVDIDT
jgi:hypothetical protein